MEEFKSVRSILVPVFICLLFILIFPRLSSALRPLSDEDLSENATSVLNKKTEHKPDTHLQPIKENQLDDLSPSLVAPPPPKVSRQKDNQTTTRMAFENSVCFKRCHSINDFKPSKNTAKQWRLLIEQDGHAIFSDIPWENPQEKASVLNYLLNNSRTTKPESAGIGVW